MTKDEYYTDTLLELRGIKANGDWDDFEALKDRAYELEETNPQYLTEEADTLLGDPQFIAYMGVVIKLGEIRDRAMGETV